MTRRNFEVNAYHVLEIQTKSILPGSSAIIPTTVGKNPLEEME